MKNKMSTFLNTVRLTFNLFVLVSLPINKASLKHLCSYRVKIHPRPYILPIRRIFTKEKKVNMTKFSEYVRRCIFTKLRFDKNMSFKKYRDWR